jgi:aspartate dehydrogenase
MNAIGLIGAGFVARQLYAALAADTSRFRVVFVQSRRQEALDFVPPQLRLADLDQATSRGAALVIEAAHPDVTRTHGAALLAAADYMPLSTTALADDRLRARLVAVAAEAGTRLLLPHGAVVGLDSLLAWRAAWCDVQVMFRKPPSSIDFTRLERDPATITQATTIYDGPVRGAARLFPRNVNAMVTCALATVGLDRCRATVIADPAANLLSLDIVAHGKDGSVLTIRRQQPASGVSGTEMFASLLRSIDTVVGTAEPLAFV